ncbi:hypothetical protein Emag_006893 [Eimeria magna]
MNRSLLLLTHLGPVLRASVGSSPPLAVSPHRAPDVQEPLQRRRRLEPVSALFSATPDSLVEVQSPSAQANNDLAGADTAHPLMLLTPPPLRGVIACACVASL